ncbi:hypothetical protein V2G26_015638 [Clonostachys chloroleuca]
MDARSMDDQDQIRGARRKRELKIEELRREKFLRKTLVQRLSVIDHALEARCGHNSTLGEIMGTVETALEADGKDFEGRPPCSACVPGRCQHLESFNKMFVGIIFNAFSKAHHTAGATSLEAWLRVFMAEVFAKKDNIQDELWDITQQLTQLEKRKI